MDSLKACDKVCFTVYGNETVKDIAWAPYVQSAVVFGRCHLIGHDESEKAVALLRKFAMKYYPSEDMVDDQIVSTGMATQMFEIEIEHISGKEVQES